MSPRKPKSKVTATAKRGTARPRSVAADTKPVRPVVSQIDRTIGIPLWRQIAADIESEIESGHFKPGTRLETETQLAAHYGVNRHTLRRALATLVASGLVSATPRRGTFVATTRLSYPITRNTRFSETVTSAGRSPSGRLIDAKRLLATEDVASNLGVMLHTPVLRLRHVRLANGMPICVTTAWFPAERFPRLATLYRRSGSITKALASHGVVDYHRKRTRVTARAATPEERETLNLPRSGIVLAAHTIDVDADGLPIQSAETRFAADRVELLIES